MIKLPLVRLSQKIDRQRAMLVAEKQLQRVKVVLSTKTEVIPKNWTVC